MEWTASHVDKEEDETFESMANWMADYMTMVGRGRIERGTIMPTIPVIFPGTVAALVIGKIIINNQMKVNLRKHCQIES